MKLFEATVAAVRLFTEKDHHVLGLVALAMILAAIVAVVALLPAAAISRFLT